MASLASSSAVAAVPSSSASSSSSPNRLHHFILRGAAPFSSLQSISSAVPSEPKDQREEKAKNEHFVAANSRSKCSTESSVICRFANGRKETRTFVDPAKFFARQSLNASRMARRTNTRHRFQQQNALFEDLLLAEAERDAVPTALTIRGTPAPAARHENVGR
ncbi:hypothetical protein niasHT_021946 [Heterodera trifolii]|uniref:Uncharacterized protein n=1 Tax=Heterodera trifolii TaxID=157864 RepID=A0ABD2K015_9BILA